MNKIILSLNIICQHYFYDSLQHFLGSLSGSGTDRHVPEPAEPAQSQSTNRPVSALTDDIPAHAGTY